MHATTARISTLYAGDIAAAVGLKNTTTGDTLCDENIPLFWSPWSSPSPVIRVAIEPKTKAGRRRWAWRCCVWLKKTRPSRPTPTRRTGQTIIAGMGELHLEIIVDRLLREFKVEATVGKPQVTYKETIRKTVKAEGRYAVRPVVTASMVTAGWRFPNEPGKGYEFEHRIVGGAIPKEYIPLSTPVFRARRSPACWRAIPLWTVKVTLWDGSYHEVDSSEMAFYIAGSMAFKDAMEKADPVLMEPIMKVDVIVPDEYMGDVMGDLNSRRGEIQGMESPGAQPSVNAYVPLCEMFGYATDLRSKTQGRGQYSMEPTTTRRCRRALQKDHRRRARRSNFSPNLSRKT